MGSDFGADRIGRSTAASATPAGRGIGIQRALQPLGIVPGALDKTEG